MKIEKVVVGYLKENCYILEKNNQVLVVDPGDEAEKIKEKINKFLDNGRGAILAIFILELILTFFVMFHVKHILFLIWKKKNVQ